MRSLSLESILVNKNMKLLILLVTLLVQTNPSLSMPTPDLELIFSEILQSLEELKAVSQHDLKVSQLFLHNDKGDFTIFIILALAQLKIVKTPSVKREVFVFIAYALYKQICIVTSVAVISTNLLYVNF